MFTVEQDFDETIITLLDESAANEDVKFTFTDEGVEIYQFEFQDKYEIFNYITLSNSMLDDLFAAYNSPEGTYKIIEVEVK